MKRISSRSDQVSLSVQTEMVTRLLPKSEILNTLPCPRAYWTKYKDKIQRRVLHIARDV